MDTIETVIPCPDMSGGENVAFCRDCGVRGVAYNGHSALVQCHACGSVDTARTADVLRALAGRYDTLRVTVGELGDEVARVRALLDASRRETVSALADRDEALRRTEELRRQIGGYRLENRELREQLRKMEGAGVAR